MTLVKTLLVGSEHEGKLQILQNFGLFIKLTDEVDGLIHINDLSWEEKPEEAVKKFKKGD